MVPPFETQPQDTTLVKPSRSRHIRPLAPSPYPDEELQQHHVPFAARQVQGRAPVPVPAGLVHLLPSAMGQQQDHRPQVLLGRGPQQVLAQGELQALQRGQEELLLVLGANPELFFFPREARGDRSLSPGVAASRAQPTRQVFPLPNLCQESRHRDSSPKPCIFSNICVVHLTVPL